MAEWVQGDKMTVALMNQKTVYVGVAVPATPYNGQVWVCTSSDPSLAKVYDATNTRWMEHHETRYETVASGQTPISGVYLNGTLCVAYDTQQSGTKLYAYANSSWRDMGGTLVRAYPVGGINSFSSIYSGRYSITVCDRYVLNSGQEQVMISTNITPSNSGDVVCLFAGGLGNSTQNPVLRIYVGTAQVGADTMDDWTPTVMASTAVVSNTSTNISMRIYSALSGYLTFAGLSLGAVIVKT